MAFIEPMHRNKPNITYLLTYLLTSTGYTGLQKTASSKVIYIQMLKSWQNQHFLSNEVFWVLHRVILIMEYQHWLK